MCLLLQVLHVGDEHEWINDAIIVEEHTNDLASVVGVHGLDHGVDSVTDALCARLRIHLLKSVKIYATDAWLLSGGFASVHFLVSCGSAHHLGLSGLSLGSLGLIHLHLLWRHGHGHALGGATWLTLYNSVVVTRLRLAWATVPLVVVVLTVTVLVLAAALTVVASLAAVVLVVAAGAGVVVCIATSVVDHTWGALHLATEATLEVLQHLVVAALLALLVQLLGGHPELDGEWASTEGCRLIEALDSSLGAVDFLVQNEVLAVCSIWVEIFALTKLD